MKIAVFTGNRADYGLIRPVIDALASEGTFHVNLIVSGSHKLEMFGETASEIDGSKLESIFEIDVTKSISDGHIRVADSFSQIVAAGSKHLKDINPDLILIAGDRHETFAFAIAAFYNVKPIAHLFGGDLSQGGHLDDSVRHAITKLANIHLVTNADSYARVVKLGEEPWRVFDVGSPAVDTIVNSEYASPEEVCAKYGLNRDQPILIFTQHPVTTEPELAYSQVKESLEALKALQYQTIITFPCSDPGGESIINAINEYKDVPHFTICKSLGWKYYLGCMNIASCVVGNSSSGLLETPYFKVPCINIGTRQKGRLRSENVIDAPYDRMAIKNAIKQALFDKEFSDSVKSCSTPYGNGQTSEKIVQILRQVSLDSKLLQKNMTY